MAKKSKEIAPLRQERFPSENPDLDYDNVIPRCTEYDLQPVPSRTHLFGKDEFTFKSPKPGNQVRRDGKQ